MFYDFSKILSFHKIKEQGKNVLYFLNRFIDCKTVHPIAVNSPLGTTNSTVFKETSPTWQVANSRKVRKQYVV